MTRLLFFLSIITYTSFNCASQYHKKKPTYKDITVRNTQCNHHYASQYSAPSAAISYRDITIRNIQLDQKKYCKQRKSKTKIPITQQGSAPRIQYFDLLPKGKELHRIIINFATNEISTKKLIEATQTFRAILGINKYFNNLVGTPLFTDNFIKDLAAKYHWSHESIARSLRTKQSKARIQLQEQLRTLCCTPEDNEDDDDVSLKEKLHILISEKVNLEFIYNHKSEQKTPLMLSMDYDNNMFKYLLEYGANINGTNSVGIGPLHNAVSNPINENYCMRLITDPAIAINQKNCRGETALLYALINTPRIRTNRPLVKVVKAMLKAGINPKSGNKRGRTPLQAAQKLKNITVVNIIQQAIKTKRPAKL